jgi:hypothetical protein
MLSIFQKTSGLGKRLAKRKDAEREESFLRALKQKEREMMIPTPRRRDLLLMAAAGVAAAPALAPTSAAAYQGNMEHALSALGAAMQSLQAATPNKGGHRERAIHLIERAMGEVQAGIDFANAHGGGGY